MGDEASIKVETPTLAAGEGKKKKPKAADSKDELSRESNKGTNKKVKEENGNQSKKSDELSIKMETPTLIGVEGKKKKQKRADSKDEISHEPKKGPHEQEAEKVNRNQSKKSEASVKIETP